MRQEVESRGLGFAWDPGHCPAVFTGPDTAGAHYQPTDRRVERGHVLNMDFGVKYRDYCSDIQRTFYLLEEGEQDAPEEVRRGFDTIEENMVFTIEPRLTVPGPAKGNSNHSGSDSRIAWYLGWP